MFKSLKPSEQNQEESSLANWIWNSHNWVEDIPGHYHCIWCKEYQTSYSPISLENNLCPKNPAVLKVVEKIKNAYNER